MNIALPLATLLTVFCGSAQAQVSGPGTAQVPKSPDERNWYPQTNIFSPSTLLGIWFLVDGTTLRQQSLQPSSLTIDTSFINAQVYSYNRTKDTEASAAIPAFASVSLKDQESQSLTIDDISLATIKGDIGDPFCREWSKMKKLRKWSEGDRIIYIVSDLLSHVAWKIGKVKDISAGASLGNYFSAGGQQYEQTAVSAILPAQSFPQVIDKTISLDDLTDKTCPLLKPAPHARPMFSTPNSLRLRSTSVVLFPDKK